MSDNELFGEADARSEDSFIVNSEPSVHSEDDDYEFLFGTHLEEDVDKKSKTRGKRVKDLENLLKERRAVYNDFEGTDDEIRYTVDELADHWDRRQALESEILSLFSSLLTKEQISVGSTHTAHTQSIHSVYNEHNLDGESHHAHGEFGGSTSFQAPESSRSKPEQTQDADTKNASNESNRIVGKLMKRLIKQTFRDKAPEGRFGSYSKASEAEKEKTNHEFRLNTVTSIGKDVLLALRDINTLLNRERGNDYEELDGVPLYKHTRPVTIYIFMNNFVLSHISPLCTLLSRGAVTNPDIDADAISKEIIYLLYQLSQPPSEAWYKYWVEAEHVYTSLNTSGSKDDGIASEIKYRMRVIEDYVSGLGVLRNSVVSHDIWFLVGEFRVKLEHFKREKFRTPAQIAHMHDLRELQEKLSTERDELVKEMKGDDDDDEENTTHGRLRKDRNVRDANRRRLQELRKQLVRISGEIADENESVAVAEKQTLLHIATVRILVVQILTIPGNDLSILVILNEAGLLTTVKSEIIASFESCKSGFVVSEDGNVESHAAYLSETQRATLWEYVRLLHAITSCVSISRLFATPYTPTKHANMRHSERKTGRGSDTQSRISNDDQKIIELARLNPKLARMRIRGSVSDISTFKIDEHTGRARKLSDYDRLFRFPTSVYTNPYSSFLNDSDGTSGKYTSRFAEGVTSEHLKNLQLELQSLVGIDIDFEHIHYNQDGVHIYYELGLLLSLLFSDVAREAEDRYSLPCDVEVLLDLKSWVISYYTTLYLNENKRRDSKGLEKLPEAFVLLALRRYVGNDNLMPKVTCMYIWRLIRKSGMRKSSSLGAASALRSFYADLMLVFSFSNCLNEHVLDILKQLISSYLTNNIKSALFWILRFFKPLSHTVHIFIYSLSSLHLLSKIVNVMGNISYTVEKSQNRTISLDYDYDSDDSVDGGLTKKVVLSKNSIFSSKHVSQDIDSTPKDVVPDILYNGRVVYNCVFLLSNFRNNDPYLNDLLITHLEMLPPGLLYDLKYFYTFRNIIKDRRVWQNAHWRWIGEFCIYTLEHFFDSWLITENFKTLPLELFYSKASTATVGPFRPCARDHILPLSNGYNSCQILGSLLKNPDSSIYEVAREVKGMPMSLWTKEDDAALLKYASQFSFLDDPHTYIAELLGRPVKEVTTRLVELNEQMHKDEDIGDADMFMDVNSQALKLKEVCNIFHIRYPDIAFAVLSELHENISESIEMKRLGGLDAICEVMEPISASQDILDSPEFTSILACLKIENWILPSDLEPFEQFLQVIKDPDAYTSADVPQNVSGNAGGPADTTVYDIYKPGKFEALKMNFTSRDIAKLILDIKDLSIDAKSGPDSTSIDQDSSMETLEKSLDSLNIFGNGTENKTAWSNDYVEILQEGLRLIDSAVILGRSESMCKNLPKDIAPLQKLSELLKIANVRINPPLLICESVGDGTIARDRLQMAINLFKLPEKRLRDISSYVPRGFTTEDTHQAQSTVDTDLPMDDEATLDFSKDPFESTLVNRTKKKRLKKLRTVENDKPIVVDESGSKTSSLEKSLQTYRKGLKFGRLKKRNKLDLVLGNVLERLSSGLYEMNAAELMSLGMDTSLFKDFDKSLTNLSNIVESSGATVQYVGDRLMFIFTPESSQTLKDYLEATFKETEVSAPKRLRVKKRRNIPAKLDIGVGVMGGLDPVETFDFDPFKRLESSIDLVSQLHKQSLELAAQKRLYNGITREALQTML